MESQRSGEVILTYDAQNRMAAMLRGTAVCTYLRDDSTDKEVKSVSLYTSDFQTLPAS